MFLLVEGCLSQVWIQEFPFLKIRPDSLHAQCSRCIRHKNLIKELSSHLLARQRQQELFGQHLRSQYRDRLCYWGMRRASRLAAGSPGTTTEVVVILDGMDQAKASLPRGACMKSKDLSSFVRPRCSVTGVLCHGHFVLFAVTPPNLAKDSNCVIEIAASSLQRLADSGVLLSQVFVRFQSDNTSRECKHNPFLRWLTGMVSSGFLGLR